MSKTIFAIDPGNTFSAYVVFTPEKILFKGRISNPEMIVVVRTLKGELIDPRLSIEMISSYGMAVGKEVFETCVWIGRFMEAFGSENVDLVYRQKIKLHHCNSVRAKDGNVRQALIDKYGAPGTKKNQGFTYGVSADIWSAMALAAYIYETDTSA